MGKKKALGRGLNELLGEIEDDYINNLGHTNTNIEIDMDLIIPNPYQPRKVFDTLQLEELAQSIKEHGVIQPILLAKDNDTNRYIIIAGERRFRASKLIDSNKIKAIITDYDIKKLRELSLIENIQRENLNAIELALAYQDLLATYNITQDELSTRVNKSRSSISNALRLLNLVEYVQQKLLTSQITAGHAKILVTLNSDEQVLITDKIIKQNLSVRDAEKLVANLHKIVTKKETVQLNSYNIDTLKNVVVQLKDLGLKSKIKKNSFILEFNNETELKLIEKLFNKID